MKFNELRIGLDVMINKKAANGNVRRTGIIIWIPTQESKVRRVHVRWYHTNKTSAVIFSRLVLANSGL